MAKYQVYTRPITPTEVTTMAKTVKSDLKTEHATYASDFVPSDVENVSFLGDPYPRQHDDHDGRRVF